MLNVTKKPFAAAVCSLLILPWLESTGSCQSSSPSPTVRRLVAMEYPWFARMATLQGTVELAARINSEGIPEKIQVLSGPEPLASPAKETLSKWRLAECIPSGPKCLMKFVFSFALAGSCNISHCPTEFEVDLPEKISVKSKIFDTPIAARQADGRKANH